MTFAPSSSTPNFRLMYSLICTCIDGKMCGRASCSVLSRSKIHTRLEGAMPAMRITPCASLRANQRADALVGEHLEQQRMRHAPVDDVHGLHPAPCGFERR